ncbi:MAG: ABC transporter permease [bacterium]|nr:ABC transporter permease [bacterium]
MSASRVYAIFLRQMYLIAGNPTRLSSVFLWLLIDVVQWGFVRKYLTTFGEATFSFVTVILGAIIFFEFCARIQHGIMTSFLEDIWSQNLINYFASPLKLTEYLSGLVLTSIVTAVAGLSAMVLLAGVAFGYDVLAMGMLIMPFMVILFLFGAAMGVFVSGVILRFGPTAEWLGWPIPFLLSVFVGVYYPIATLPQAMQVIARLIPASYVFESMRAILSGEAAVERLWVNLIVAGVLAVVYLVGAYAFFVRIYKRNLRTGAIARFSAESL